jgi:hypothetical protein
MPEAKQNILERDYMRQKPGVISASCVFVLAAAMMLQGCGYLVKTRTDKPEPKVDRTAAKYDSGTNESLTSVESALILSEKYATLAVESEKMRQENKKLTEDNVDLSKKMAALQAEFDQVSKELKDANAMLIDMRIEINNWKNSVLGFRDEMRASQGAQLDAMLRIMKLLGGESQKEQGKIPSENKDNEPNSKK